MCLLNYHDANIRTFDLYASENQIKYRTNELFGINTNKNIMEDGVIERVEVVIADKNISNKKFAELIGIEQTTFNNYMLRKRKPSLEAISNILSTFEDISPDWLLTGKGEMLRCGKEKSLLQVLHTPKIREKIIEQQSIPVYNIEAAANLKTVFDNKDQFILGEITMPDIPRCDGAVYVRGDSMYPLLKSGDLVGYKELTDPSDLIYGEMYLVAFDLAGDEYVAVKYINKSEIPGCVKLVSYNTYYDPKDIEISRLSAVALVKFSIRKNTIA